jgi:putative transposase
MPEDLISEPLCRALPMRQPAARLVVHSDQGSQYSATNFKAVVARHKAVQSMSRRISCYNNAHALSFWSQLETGLLAGDSFRSLSEARLIISHYIAYYNAEHRHSALSYHAPTISKPILNYIPTLCNLVRPPHLYLKPDSLYPRTIHLVDGATT